MQPCLTSRQTRWMDYLTRFNFDIRYVKGTLNKVADVLSQYYEHDFRTGVPEIQDYVNADIHLDPEHDNLLWQRLFKVKEGIIELRIRGVNSAKVVDPTIFESRAKGVNLCETMSHTDTFEDDIHEGYLMDPWFRRIKEKIQLHPLFREHDRFIWARNREGKDVVCVPHVRSNKTTVQSRILEQAHQVVGHFG
ncbi:hypothetical protein L208DRAFT_1340846, partial [Tricholoma matsutake]